MERAIQVQFFAFLTEHDLLTDYYNRVLERSTLLKLGSLPH